MRAAHEITRVRRRRIHTVRHHDRTILPFLTLKTKSVLYFERLGCFVVQPISLMRSESPVTCATDAATTNVAAILRHPRVDNLYFPAIAAMHTAYAGPDLPVHSRLLSGLQWIIYAMSTPIFGPCELDTACLGGCLILRSIADHDGEMGWVLL